MRLQYDIYYLYLLLLFTQLFFVGFPDTGEGRLIPAFNILRHLKGWQLFTGETDNILFQQSYIAPIVAAVCVRVSPDFTTPCRSPL